MVSALRDTAELSVRMEDPELYRLSAGYSVVYHRFLEQDLSRYPEVVEAAALTEEPHQPDAPPVNLHDARRMDGAWMNVGPNSRASAI